MVKLVHVEEHAGRRLPIQRGDFLVQAPPEGALDRAASFDRIIPPTVVGVVPKPSLILEPRSEDRVGAASEGDWSLPMSVRFGLKSHDVAERPRGNRKVAHHLLQYVRQARLHGVQNFLIHSRGAVWSPCRLRLRIS